MNTQNSVELSGADLVGRIERRQTDSQLAISTRDDGGGLRITGYGAVFYRDGEAETEYTILDDFVERIHPEAFSRALEEDDVRALFNHDANQILGRSQAGTLRLAVDDTGLRYDIDLPDSDIGRRVATAIERGDVTGSSFSFRARHVGIEEEQGITIRELRDVQVMDVGPVTYPAYAGTTAGVREQDQRACDELLAWRASCQAIANIRTREADKATVAADLAALGLL